MPLNLLCAAASLSSDCLPIFASSSRSSSHSYSQFHALRDLLILESGSLAVLAEVSFFFIPFILAQNDDLLLLPFFLLGAFRSLPGFALSYDLRPFSFNPPDLFFPSFLVHAALSDTNSPSAFTLCPSGIGLHF